MSAWIQRGDDTPEIDKDVLVRLSDSSVKIGFLSLEGDWIVSKVGEGTIGETFHDDGEIMYWAPIPD